MSIELQSLKGGFIEDLAEAPRGLRRALGFSATRITPLLADAFMKLEKGAAPPIIGLQRT